MSLSTKWRWRGMCNSFSPFTYYMLHLNVKKTKKKTNTSVSSYPLPLLPPWTPSFSYEDFNLADEKKNIIKCLILLLTTPYLLQLHFINGGKRQWTVSGLTNEDRFIGFHGARPLTGYPNTSTNHVTIWTPVRRVSPTRPLGFYISPYIMTSTSFATAPRKYSVSLSVST